MEKREKWMELCELATRENDPQKLIELTSEIARLLDEKQKNIRSAAQPQNSQESLHPRTTTADSTAPACLSNLEVR